jgi:hypothetical protein
MSMDATTSRVEGLVNDLNGAIRENPLAAGLIGMGVAWMLFGGSKLPGRVPGAIKSAATAAGSAASAAGSAVAGGISEAGSRIAGTARHIQGQIQDQLQDSAADAADAAASAARNVSAPDMPGIVPEMENAFATTASNIRDALTDTAAKGREYGNAIQSRLADSLERQPLLLGAIGLAIGAGIASTFASTKLEGQVMGAQGEAAREALEGFVGDTKRRAEQVLDTVKEEAQKQGLTPDAAKQAASGIADKVKGVAGAARTSISGGGEQSRAEAARPGR